VIDTTTGIWLDNEQAHWNDGDLLARLLHIFDGKTVYDFGCGNGFYVGGLRVNGIDCIGFDGNPTTQVRTDGFAGVMDLSKPVDLPRRDWVMSLEVGEHIPVAHESTFIRNLNRNCREGIVLSWAVPGQGGEGHVNERTNEYIVELFRDLGFDEAMVMERQLRKSAKLEWFKNTLMVFVRTRSLK